MTFMMWNWWSVYIAGELKAASKLSRQLTIMIGALFWDSLFIIAGVLLLFHTAGEKFMASISYLAGQPTGYPLPVAPYYNLFASLSANSGLFAVLVAVSFLFWNLPAMFPNTFMPVRSIFAWSFRPHTPREALRGERAHACAYPGDHHGLRDRVPHPGMVCPLHIVLHVALNGRAGWCGHDHDGCVYSVHLPMAAP